jgi:hypothetical protein
MAAAAARMIAKEFQVMAQKDKNGTNRTSPHRKIGGTIKDWGWGNRNHMTVLSIEDLIRLQIWRAPIELNHAPT